MESQEQLEAKLAERTNRMSVGLVRTLLFAAVFAQLGFVIALLVWLWHWAGPGATFLVGALCTAIWVAWLRMVEFERFRPAAPVTQRFKAPQ